MDFLASPPDVQIDWMSAMMLEVDHQSDFSQSPISPTPSTLSVPLLSDAYRFDEPAKPSAMKEMVFRMAAMQPVHVIDQESVKPPKRRNVRISKDPQSVAARHRRERISERIRILQRMVPGGTKMDTASMLDEAVQYLKFLKSQVTSLERAGFGRGGFNGLGFGGSGPLVGVSFAQGEWSRRRIDAVAAELSGIGKILTTTTVESTTW